MARKRMYSPKIVESDEFLDMPDSAKTLYFYLNLNADDDGFVQPKKIMRMLGSTDDSLRILITKRFAFYFDSGVVILTHWHENNFIRKDRYTATLYQEESKQLSLDDNGFYLVNQSVTSGQPRLDKIRLDKISIEEREDTPTIKEFNRKSDINDTVIQDIANKYAVSVPFVEDCWDSAQNWLLANGKNKKDYRAFLVNWVKKERASWLIKAKGGNNTPRTIDLSHIK